MHFRTLVPPPQSATHNVTLEDSDKTHTIHNNQKQIENPSTSIDQETTSQSIMQQSLGNSNDPTHNQRTTLAENQALMEDGIQVKPIGIIRSVYRLCVGTPRQGLLAPNARGYIDLLARGHSSPASSIEGLEAFSHIWIVFIFHLNTQSGKNPQRIKSKITPPAYGGQKVGIFATRTPHRFNPIGMTLCKLDRIEHLDKRNVRLHISGMDLVDGTPVLDIKPYVPVYDSVVNDVRLPNWVEGGLASHRTVIVNEDARKELQTILEGNIHALDFYGPKNGDETLEATLENVLGCIRQVLAMDVRSSYQTKKSRAGKFQAERSSRLSDATRKSESSNESETPETLNSCTQQLDNLLIKFELREQECPRESASTNSGAEDTVFVTSIKLLVE